MQKWVDRTFGMALGASLALHAGGASAPLVYEWWTGRPAPFFFARPLELPRKMPVEFVDAPDAAPEAKTASETRKISDKETVARDQKTDDKPAPVQGPAAPLVKEAQQLAKKSQPDQRVDLRQGMPEPKQEFMTPEDPLKKKVAEDIPKEEQVEKLQKKVAEMEEMKMLLEQVQQKKLEEQKQKEKAEDLLKPKVSPPGNSPKQVQVQIFNPARNLDTYTSQEVQKFLASAVNVGESSFDAKKHILGPYLKKVKSKISPLWHLKLESKSWGDLYTEKKIVLGFKILAGGDLAEIIIIEDHGDTLFNQICIETIKEAAPFNPLPTAWLEQSGNDFLNLIYTFVIF